MVSLILLLILAVIIYKSLVFGLSLWLKRNDIADVSWGLSFILILIVNLWYTKNFTTTALVVSALVIVWGLRLAVRIYLRNRGRKEDFRYQKLREESPNNFLLRSFLQVYLLQGILAVIVSLPVIFLVSSKNPLTQTPLPLILGVSVWLVGFFFEVVGDYQLDKFISNPDNKGRVLQKGLWKFSRHPNYFGELTMWWGIFLIALPVPNGYLSVLGPLTITFLITKVSGIPPLEKNYAGNQEFEHYKAKTSMLIPLPPKS